MIGVYYYTWTYVGLVLLMFIHFFIRSYLCRGGRPKSKEGSKENGTNTKTKIQEPKKDR